jgi:GNAT superfamily N-acetyltransferase
MDETDEATPAVSDGDVDLNQLLGLFDVPAFARRGRDLEYALSRLHLRLDRERAGMLDMVRVRLKQWAAVAIGPDDWGDAFAAPVAPLYALAAAEPPVWAAHAAPPRRRRGVARDLVASIARFNRRWRHVIEGLKLDKVNQQIDDYNRYYVLEKECVIGSARLAARHFVPKPLLNHDVLLADHPLLPLPDPVG